MKAIHFNIQELAAYLAPSRYIDWQHPAVLDKARALAGGDTDPVAVARRCYLFVRDHIRHSNDYGLNPVTCTASDALAHRTGFCYAKSHLLAALLRANGIPAGLCYQRLTIADEKPPFCLHALNAVFLPGMGWYRIDARGNKAGVDADFCPPMEKIAYRICVEGEMDLPEIWPEPLLPVIEVLTSCDTYQAVAADLPDIQLLPGWMRGSLRS